MTAPSKPTDQQLLQALAQDQEIAFDGLFTRYYPGLLRYARTLLPFPTDAAEDTVADVFSTLWHQRRQLRIQGAVAAYLYVAVKHRIYDYLKQRRRVAVLPDDEWADAPEPAHLQPDQQLAYRELDQRILRLIEQLPPRTRLVFQLHRDEGLTYEQAAEVLDISVNSVKTHMFRALRFLKGALYVTE